MTRKEDKAELIYKEESYAIIGACFEIYKNKGLRFHEPIYHECLEIEFEFQRIPFLSNHRKVCSIAVARWFATGCKFGLLLNFCHYQDWNTTASCREAMNPSISTCEKFRVFSRV